MLPGLAGFVRVDKTKLFKPGLNRPGQNLMSGKLDETGQNLINEQKFLSYNL